MKHYKTTCALLIVASVGCFSEMPAFSADPISGEKISQKQVGQEVQEAVDAIKKYSADQRDEAVKKGRAVLDHLDVEIAAMESKMKKNWGRMEESARKSATASLEAIKKERAEVAKWVGSMTQSSAAAWEEVKKGFVESYQTLHESFDRAAQKF
ncbi:MAG: hypothetical protein HY282_08825 [Nitrospirae bacterium]|nr:hypothetical protein [Candidatus Manganitrophaceae bacterium]